MDHNQLIANFKKHLPQGSFFHYWGKSKYKSAPWDCTYIYNNCVNIIEFKYKYDKLKPHQKSGLLLASDNCHNVCAWVIRGGLKRSTIRLELLDGTIVVEGSNHLIIGHLNNSIIFHK